MRKLQANEINMISGGKSEGAITTAIVNNTFVSSIILGGVVGAYTSTAASIDGKAPTGIKALAGLAGFTHGALVGAIAHDLGSLNAKK